MCRKTPYGEKLFTILITARREEGTENNLVDHPEIIC